MHLDAKVKIVVALSDRRSQGTWIWSQSAGPHLHFHVCAVGAFWSICSGIILLVFYFALISRYAFLCGACVQFNDTSRHSSSVLRKRRSIIRNGINISIVLFLFCITGQSHCQMCQAGSPSLHVWTNPSFVVLRGELGSLLLREAAASTREWFMFCSRLCTPTSDEAPNTRAPAFLKFCPVDRRALKPPCWQRPRPVVAD